MITTTRISLRTIHHAEGRMIFNFVTIGLLICDANNDCLHHYHRIFFTTDLHLFAPRFMVVTDAECVLFHYLTDDAITC